MADIRDLGRPGKAVFETAQKLHNAKLIDDGQLRELTNDKVGPQDIAISDQALSRLQASGVKDITPNDLAALKKNVVGLQTHVMLGDFLDALNVFLKQDASATSKRFVESIKP